MSRKVPTYGPQRMWWDWGWQGWWLATLGGDEFCNRTLVLRLLPPWGALVINLERPMRNRPCEECRAEMDPRQVRSVAGTHRP